MHRVLTLFLGGIVSVRLGWPMSFWMVGGGVDSKLLFQWVMAWCHIFGCRLLAIVANSSIWRCRSLSDGALVLVA